MWFLQLRLSEAKQTQELQCSLDAEIDAVTQSLKRVRVMLSTTYHLKPGACMHSGRGLVSIPIAGTAFCERCGDRQRHPEGVGSWIRARFRCGDVSAVANGRAWV